MRQCGIPVRVGACLCRFCAEIRSVFSLKLSWRNTQYGISLYSVCVTGLAAATFWFIPPGFQQELFRTTGTFSGRTVFQPHLIIFMGIEIKSLVERTCVVKWSDVWGTSGPVRPRLIQALSAAETKPRLVYDA